MTNGDKVRQMNNDELARLFYDFEEKSCSYCVYKIEEKDCGYACSLGYGEWLEREAEDNERQQ